MKAALASEKTLLSVGAVLVGASSISLVYWLSNFGGFLVFALFLLLVFIFSFFKQLIPWRLAFLLLTSNFIAGFFCIPSWGELLPFDLAFLLINWGFFGLVGKLGIYLGGKYNVSHT